ncbi:hypothetical protein A2U01_0061009, partial [Trifolium medium]|nr:hypothetical protein [Trifolium medium]
MVLGSWPPTFVMKTFSMFPTPKERSCPTVLPSEAHE